MPDIDVLPGYEDKVDAAISANQEVVKLSTAIDEAKSFFRDAGSKLIGINETSIKFQGNKGLLTVTYPQKKKVKINRGVDPETLKPKLRDLFFKKVTKYEPVENFETLAEQHSDILDFVTFEMDTPRVTIPK
ncbi:MAG: hypothetical protein ACOYLO_00245 [Ferruginibacter sp.]